LLLYRRALSIRETTLGPDDAEVATSLQDLGTHLGDAGNYDEALKVLERALAIRRKIYGPAHPLVGFTELALAGVYDSANRIADAERDADDALAIFRKTLPEGHPKISESLNQLGILRTEHRDFVGAVPLFREVLARFLKTSGIDHPDTLVAQNNLAATLQHVGAFAEAEQLEREVLAHVRDDNGQGTAATDCQNLATTLEHEGKFAEAVTFAQRALDLQKRREGETSGNVAVALRSLAVAEELNGNVAEAERDFRATLTMGMRLKATQGLDLFQWQIPLADFLVAARQCDEAVPLLQSAIAALGANTNTVSKAQAQLLFGYCLAAGRQRAQGEAMQAAARGQLRALQSIEIDLYPTARSLLGTPAMSQRH
jgi:tetratricopeptide (TPR) repeat protein